MKISVSSDDIEKHKSGLLVVPVFEKSPMGFQPKDVNGKEGESSLLYGGYRGNKRVLFVGLGERKKFNIEKLRKASSAGVREAKRLKLESLSISLPKGLESQELANAAAEGIVLGNYRFDKYIKKEKGDKEVKGFTLLSRPGFLKGMQDTATVCQNTNMVRDMVNENADIMTTDRILQIARGVAKLPRVKLKVFEKPQLKRMGMNLLLAVGAGSRFPPRMIVLEYSGGGKGKYALLGKGITFDSGGLNLKPTKYIETMKQDMGGAAAVIGTIKSLAELKAGVNVVGVVPTCENAIGSHSYKPGDVYRSYSGKTVEIENTDAEGRLILADAIAWTDKNVKPDLMIDIATLTGAALVILGEFGGIVVGNSESHVKQLKRAGLSTYERVWDLPLWEEFKEQVKGTISDVRNLGYNNRYAGVLMGAAFLHSFAEKSPLVHIDIGGSAWTETARGYLPKYASGFGVRLLTEFFRNLSH